MRQILFTLPKVVFLSFFSFFLKEMLGGAEKNRRVFEQIAPVLTGSIQTL